MLLKNPVNLASKCSSTPLRSPDSALWYGTCWFLPSDAAS